MGVLQGLLGYVRSSAKKLFSAMFGWAVVALFGIPSESEKTLLTAVVGAAAAWPLLLLGIAFPKLAAFVLVFAPIPKWVPSSAVRIGWIVAAAAVPAVVGVALARRGKGKNRRGSLALRLLRGFPATLAISAAFLVAFVTAPLRRLRALAKRWKDEHVPLLVDRSRYRDVAKDVRATLLAAEIRLERAKAPVMLTAPPWLLGRLGGAALRRRTPNDLEFFRSPSLEVVVTPNGITLQGDPTIAARAHGLIGERATFLPGLQTTEAEAQRLERKIQEVWKSFASSSEHQAGGSKHPAGSRVLLASLRDVSEELGQTFVAYDEWQVLYREILQVMAAIRGETQLLKKTEGVESEERGAAAAPRHAGALSLVRKTSGRTK